MQTERDRVKEEKQKEEQAKKDAERRKWILDQIKKRDIKVKREAKLKAKRKELRRK